MALLATKKRGAGDEEGDSYSAIHSASPRACLAVHPNLSKPLSVSTKDNWGECETALG